MDTKTFMDVVFLKFEKNITDQIFCFIEADRELMNHYLDLLSEKDSQQLRHTNSQIAQLIAKRYYLQNTGVENEEPKSHLIQSFSELKYK